MKKKSAFLIAALLLLAVLMATYVGMLKTKTIHKPSMMDTYVVREISPSDRAAIDDALQRFWSKTESTGTVDQGSSNQ